MSKKIIYDTHLVADDDFDGTHCPIPFNVEETFGKKRVKIKATIDEVVYRGLLTPMGGEYCLMINKKVRAALGKVAGDAVHVVIEEDLEPRIVEVPTDFEEAMSAENIKPFFDALSYTHQKEYVNWIVEAKRPETRVNRIVKAIAMMKEGEKGI